MSGDDAMTDRDRAALARWERIEPSNPELIATLGHAPDRLHRFVHYHEHVVEDGLTPRRLKDAIRNRVAELHELGSRFELPEDPSELDLPEDLEPDERALVRFVDAYAIDHHSVPDGIYSELHARFDIGQLTELLWYVAVARAMSRAGAALGIFYQRPA